MASAFKLVSDTIEVLKNWRSEKKFNEFFEDMNAKIATNGLAFNPQPTRSSRPNKVSKVLSDSIVLSTIGQRSVNNKKLKMKNWQH